ncbi:MAG: hypothetical protein JRF63_14465 [Deltaproteobacteria bacterium]|nr:hypothetical protein [Deltaproteobacteria bacterium]
MPSVNRALFPWFAVLLSFGAVPMQAAASETPARLSLLTACGGAAPSAEEKRLRAELELALDGFDILVVDPGRADFPELQQDQQIDVIREATSNAADTSPVVWLECDIQQQPVVRLLVTDGGMPFVRVLSGDSFEEIALIVRELIGAALPPPPEPEPVDGDVPVSEPPPDEPPAPKEPPSATIGILSAVELGGGLVGHEGDSFLWGAGIAVDVRLAIGFFGRVALLGKIGPRSEEGEFLILGQRIEPRVELGYLWEVGRFAVGPVVGLSPFLSLRSSKETLHKTPTMDLVGMAGLIVRI